MAYEIPITGSTYYTDVCNVLNIRDRDPETNNEYIIFGHESLKGQNLK